MKYNNFLLKFWIKKYFKNLEFIYLRKYFLIFFYLNFKRKFLYFNTLIEKNRFLTILNLGAEKGHKMILNLFVDNSFIMVGDYVQPILVLIRNYNILIPVGNVWMNHNWWCDYADQVWFTDGSKQTGTAVFGPNLQQELLIAKNPSIFQAEIYAISKRMSEKEIEVTLTVLSAYEIRWKDIMDYITTLNVLGIHNTSVGYLIMRALLVWTGRVFSK